MALPAFREDGWLPEGHHAATWQEVALRFGGEPSSRRVRGGLDMFDLDRQRKPKGVIEVRL